MKQVLLNLYLTNYGNGTQWLFGLVIQKALKSLLPLQGMLSERRYLLQTTWVKYLLANGHYLTLLLTNFHPYVSQFQNHCRDVIMGAMASQITSLTIICSTVHSCADQRKRQSYAWLAFVRGIHRWPVNSPHKGPVTRKIYPVDDGIMMIGKTVSDFNTINIL